MSPRPDEILIALDAGGGIPSAFFMIPAFIAIFYFVMIRPQQKEAKELASLVASLQKGDRVVTSGGIHGKIHEAKGETLVLEISPNAYITVDRETVRRKVDPTKLTKPGDTKGGA